MWILVGKAKLKPYHTASPGRSSHRPGFASWSLDWRGFQTRRAAIRSRPTKRRFQRPITRNRVALLAYRHEAGDARSDDNGIDPGRAERGLLLSKAIVFPAIPILIAVACTFIGLVVLWCGLIGQSTLAWPLCRACGLDLRGVAWDDAPRCPGCAKAIVGDRSVRWRGRRRSRTAIGVGAVLLSVALVLLAIDRALVARGLSWRELRPASFELAAIGTAGRVDREAMQSLIRRVDAGWLGASSRAQVVDHAIAAIKRPAPVQSLWYDLALSALEAGDPRMDSLLNANGLGPTLRGLQQAGDDRWIELDAVRNPWRSERAMSITVWDDIAIDDVPIAGRFVIAEASAAMLSLPKSSHANADAATSFRGRWRLLLVPRNAGDAIRQSLRDGTPLPAHVPVAEASGVVTVAMPPGSQQAQDGGASPS